MLRLAGISGDPAKAFADARALGKFHVSAAAGAGARRLGHRRAASSRRDYGSGGMVSWLARAPATAAQPGRSRTSGLLLGAGDRARGTARVGQPVAGAVTAAPAGMSAMPRRRCSMW